MKSTIKRSWTNKIKSSYVTFAEVNCSKCDGENIVRLGNWNRKKENYICRSCSSMVSEEKRTGNRLYNIYNLMLRRVENTTQKRTKSEDYHYKNIEICEDWLDFDVFKKWSLSNGYEDTLTIDRIDNSGNYEPSNCRWVTHSIQMQNQNLSSKNTTGLRGISFDKVRNKWKASLQADGKTWQKRFNTKEEAKNGRNEKIKEWKTEHNIQ